MKSTAGEFFSFSSHCEERTSELARLTFVKVPLKASCHEFVGKSVSLGTFFNCAWLFGCRQEKRSRFT